ncbi:MAG: malate dehydrogenase [Candidatus Omnitrophica bacterium]|nr:malate dehydrogenase [Candidatus Omnitrophota bacterium]
MKISVIGAGNVGATLAMRIVESNMADVVLVDILDGLAKGKAVDISDAAPILGHEKNIEGTTDISKIKDSDVVVMTAGLARKPGMSRDDLIGKNAAIIGAVAQAIRINCPKAIVVVVTNPLDVMTYHMIKITGFSKNKVLGMAGTLDSSRLINILAEQLNVERKSIETIVLACHGDTMVPVLSATKVNGRPLYEVLPKEKIEEVINKTKFRGSEIVEYLKTGSAYYSTSAGVLQILNAIKNDTDQILPVSAYLDGEYEIKECCLGVPVKIGRNGINEIVEITLTAEERAALQESAQKTIEMIRVLS